MRSDGEKNTSLQHAHARQTWCGGVQSVGEGFKERNAQLNRRMRVVAGILCDVTGLVFAGSAVGRFWRALVCSSKV